MEASYLKMAFHESHTIGHWRRIGPQNLLSHDKLSKVGYMTTEDDTSGNFGRSFWRYSRFSNSLKKVCKDLPSSLRTKCSLQEIHIWLASHRFSTAALQSFLYGIIDWMLENMSNRNRGGGQMGKSTYAMGGGLIASVHVRTMGRGVKFRHFGT